MNIPGTGNYLVDMYEQDLQAEQGPWKCKRCGSLMPADERTCDCQDTNLND